MAQSILWFDVETTDSKADRGGGIHQLSYILEVGGKEIVRRNFRTRPFKNDLVNAQSLKVCNVTYEQIMEYPPAVDAFKILINDIHPHRRVVLGGFNNSIFDNPYLQSWWFKCRNELKKFDLNILDYIYFDPLDVRVLALNDLLDKRHTMEYFKLSDVAKAYGIWVENEKLHDAMYDVELTRDIFYKIKNKKS
jgi:DNA polymerase-3 subunit epsilon